MAKFPLCLKHTSSSVTWLDKTWSPPSIEEKPRLGDGVLESKSWSSARRTCIEEEEIISVSPVVMLKKEIMTFYHFF